MKPTIEAIRNRPVPPNINPFGVWAFESRHDDTFFMERTHHSFLKLLFIREGSGQIEFPTKTDDCNSGDLVVVSPKLKHRIIDSPSRPISLYGLGIDLKWLKQFPEVLNELESGVYSTNRFQCAHLEQTFRRLLYLHNQEDSSSQLASISVSLGLLSELSMLLSASHLPQTGSLQETEPSDPMLESYLIWLDRNFYESISIDGGAKASGMSRRAFTTKFKQRTGVTWLEYVNRLRIQYAVELLQQTDRKIASIAFQSGFDDLSTFYRAFAKIVHKSPGECRSQV